MNEERGEKERGKTSVQEPSKSFDELLSPVAQIPDKVFSSEDGAVIMKALFKERSLENRNLKAETSILEERVKKLEIRIGVYEERMHWKNVWTVISSVLLAISSLSIALGFHHNIDNIKYLGFILIIIVVIINLLGTKLRASTSQKEG